VHLTCVILILGRTITTHTVFNQTVAAATDTKILVLKRGKAIVSKGALLLDSTYDNDPKKNAVYTSLEALEIFVQPTI